MENFGIPPELIDAADTRRSAFSTVEPYYHILECLGVFMMDKNRTRLLSDYYGESVDSVKEELGSGEYVKKSERDGEEEDGEEAEE